MHNKQFPTATKTKLFRWKYYGELNNDGTWFSRKYSILYSIRLCLKTIKVVGKFRVKSFFFK